MSISTCKYLITLPRVNHLERLHGVTIFGLKYYDLIIVLRKESWTLKAVWKIHPETVEQNQS
jgi:hypothetical protein